MTLIEIMMALSVMAGMLGLTMYTYKQCSGYGSKHKLIQVTVGSFFVNDHTADLKDFQQVKEALDARFGDDDYKVSRQEMSLSKAKKDRELLSTDYFTVISDKTGRIITDEASESNQKVYLWVGSADFIV